MKHIVASMIASSLLTSCAVMPSDQEPVLVRQGMTPDMITIIQPADQQLKVTKTVNGFNIK